MKNKIILASLFFMASSLTSCSNKKQYNHDYLYGIDEVICANYNNGNMLDTGVEGFDIDITCDLLKMLGAKSLRFRIPKSFMTVNNGIVDQEVVSYQKECIRKLKAAGVSNLIGSSQWIMPDSNTEGNVIPTIGTKKYQSYLNKLSSWWEIVSKTYPEITKWEIHNETNIDFISYEDVDNDSIEIRARITCDMMYYARLGIKKGNKKAKLVMPGIAPVYPSTPMFMLEYMYDYINSGNAPYGLKADKNSDHYFDYLCWHIYIGNPLNGDFKELADMNNQAYDVARENGDGDKPVIITEFGYTDQNDALKQELIASYYKEAFKQVKEDCPYIETVCVFRLYNEKGSSWGSTDEKTFGLFIEPSSDKGFSPKPAAYAIQEIYGGVGDLAKYE